MNAPINARVIAEYEIRPLAFDFIVLNRWGKCVGQRPSLEEAQALVLEMMRRDADSKPLRAPAVDPRLWPDWQDPQGRAEAEAGFVSNLFPDSWGHE